MKAPRRNSHAFLPLSTLVLWPSGQSEIFSVDLSSSEEVVGDKVTEFSSSAETSVSEDLADDSVTSFPLLLVEKSVREELVSDSAIGFWFNMMQILMDIKVLFKSINAQKCERRNRREGECIERSSGFNYSDLITYRN